MENLIELLESWRTRHGLTAAEAARNLGVSPQGYSNWLKRERIPVRWHPTVRGLIATDPSGQEFNELIDEMDADQLVKSLARRIPELSVDARMLIIRIASGEFENK